MNRATLSRAAGIIRHFIEEYHEKLEEQHLFPRFRKAGKLVELVNVLEVNLALRERFGPAARATKTPLFSQQP